MALTIGGPSSSALSASFVAPVNVKSHGAKGDARYFAGSITSGQATLTSSTSVFSASDVGKAVLVQGAGASGAGLKATIQSFTSGTSVTLSANAGTTVSGGRAWFGTDDTAAFNAAIDAVLSDTTLFGGQVHAPRGIYMITGTLTCDGGTQLGAEYRGGLTIVGDSPRGTMLVAATPGDAAIEVGLDGQNNKEFFGFRDLSLYGPGKTDTASIGIDNRTPGGNLRFEGVNVYDFGIGVRYHDVTTVTADQLNITRCGIGAALGYYSDAHHYAGCEFTYCDIGIWFGYFDTARSETRGGVENHASSLRNCIAGYNAVGVLIEGNDTESITIDGLYGEGNTEAFIRVATAATTGVFGHVLIENPYHNGMGVLATAIQVNDGLSVEVRGGGFRGHTQAPIAVNNTTSTVRVWPGRFRRSAELGDVKLPDGSYVTLDNKRPLVVGQQSAIPVSVASSLPSASASWLGARLRVSDVEYVCELNASSGSYAWFPLPGGPGVAAMLGGTFRTGFYYDPGSASYQAVNMTADRVVCVPFRVAKAQAFDRIACEVTSAGTGSASIRLGIYHDDGTGRPSALLADYGTVSATTTGAKELTISQTLAPGLYWLSAVAQGATTQPQLRFTSGNLPGVPAVAAGNLSSAAWLKESVSGALPTSLGTNSISSAGPRIQLRAA